MKFKRCNKCKAYKPWMRFLVGKSQCSACTAKIAKGQKHLIEQKEYKDTIDLKAMKYRYNISEEDYLTMLEDQGNCCKICFKDMTDPQLDHCHLSGNVRGILCKACNVGLGHFKDSITVLENAVEYLKKNSV